MVLNSESIVIIRIKGEHLLYSKISVGDDRLWMGECLLYSKFSPGGIFTSKVSEGTFWGKVCYEEGLLYDTGFY